jgi:hypothetical protein
MIAVHRFGRRTSRSCPSHGVDTRSGGEWLARGLNSPDRLDALVWALSELMLLGEETTAEKWARVTPAHIEPVPQRAVTVPLLARDALATGHGWRSGTRWLTV